MAQQYIRTDMRWKHPSCELSMTKSSLDTLDMRTA